MAEISRGKAQAKMYEGRNKDNKARQRQGSKLKTSLDKEWSKLEGLSKEAVLIKG